MECDERVTNALRRPVHDSFMQILALASRSTKRLADVFHSRALALKRQACCSRHAAETIQALSTGARGEATHKPTSTSRWSERARRPRQRAAHPLTLAK